MSLRFFLSGEICDFGWGNDMRLRSGRYVTMVGAMICRGRSCLWGWKRKWSKVYYLHTTHNQHPWDNQRNTPYDTLHQSLASPDGGRKSFLRLGGGMPVSGWPWGSEWFSDNQQRLSSQADRARFVKVLVDTWWFLDFITVISTFVNLWCLRTLRYVLCFILLTTDFEIPLARLILWRLSFNFILYILGLSKIISFISLPAHSSLKQPSLALLVVEYSGWVDG